MADYIKIISRKLNEICDYKAQRIPILPEVVTKEFVKDYLGDISNIPIGVSKDSLEISTINIKDKYMYNITGDDITLEPNFIKGLINNILETNNTECIVFDSISMLNDISNERITYSNDTCYKSIEKLNEAYTTNDPEKTTVCFMIGINSMINKLSPTEKDKFIEVITNARNNGNIKIFIIDTIEVIKSTIFETWYKDNVDLAEGIWIGNGIANQFTLKVTTNSRILRAEVQPGFGYVINKGKAVLVKFISDE